MPLESWCFRNGGVLTLRSRTMPRRSLSLIRVIKYSSQSKLVQCVRNPRTFLLMYVYVCIFSHVLFVLTYVLYCHPLSVFISLYRGKVGLDVAEAQHLMDGLDWQGALKDIEASVKWLKANGSEKVYSLCTLSRLQSLYNLHNHYFITFVLMDTVQYYFYIIHLSSSSHVYHIMHLSFYPLKLNYHAL